MEVGAANAAGSNPQQDLSRVQLRYGNLLDAKWAGRRLVGGIENCRSHYRSHFSTASRRVMVRELGMDPRKEENTPDLPEDQRADWAKDDREIEDRKPDLGEIEEDTSEL